MLVLTQILQLKKDMARLLTRLNKNKYEEQYNLLIKVTKGIRSSVTASTVIPKAAHISARHIPIPPSPIIKARFPRSSVGRGASDTPLPRINHGRRLVNANNRAIPWSATFGP